MLILITIISILILILAFLIFIKLFSLNSDKKILELSANLREEINEKLEKIEELIDKNFSKNREENQISARNSREEVNNSFKNFNDSILSNFSNLAKIQSSKLDEFSRNLQFFEEKFLKNNNENRVELTNNLKEFDQSQKMIFEEFFSKGDKMRAQNEEKLDLIRSTVENKLANLQEDNNKKLEEMRLTVDEKLQSTVEKRFNQSFHLISTRLEQVQKGLGEMQNLANGVGDLKKVLSNVKTRGNIGEIQLEAIIEQYFASSQYEKNAAIKENSTQRVEFAIKIPSKESEDDVLLLPIDSKFPMEDYERLANSYENADPTNQQHTKAAIDSARRYFESAVKKAAKDIHDKYLNPPKTTDFAIMFVPTEGLYAEILRSQNLFEDIQKNYRVVVLGPTTIIAFLSALQMGFRTLAVEKRSSEVWKVLGSVKGEFSKFGDLLEKTKKKLQETENVIDKASIRSRAIERQLKDVQTIEDPKKDEQIEGNSDLLSNILDVKNDNNEN